MANDDTVKRVKGKLTSPTKVDIPITKTELPNLHVGVNKEKGQFSAETIGALENLSKVAGVPDSETPKEEPKEDEFELPEIELNKMSPEMEEVKKSIEGRLEDLNFEDLITGMREMRQSVPIISEKLTVVFRTLTGAEDVFIKERVSKLDSPSNRVIIDSYMLFTLACNLISMNGKTFTEHLIDVKGVKSVDEEKFKTKADDIFGLPSQILEQLSHNYSWFEQRVRSVITGPNLKNG